MLDLMEWKLDWIDLKFQTIGLSDCQFWLSGQMRQWERESDETESDLNCQTIGMSDCQVQLSIQIRQWKRERVRSDSERESMSQKER